MKGGGISIRFAHVLLHDVVRDYVVDTGDGYNGCGVGVDVELTPPYVPGVEAPMTCTRGTSR